MAAKTALDAWNALFETLIAKYRDGYKVRWIGREGVSRIGREGLVGGWLGLEGVGVGIFLEGPS